MGICKTVRTCSSRRVAGPPSVKGVQAQLSALREANAAMRYSSLQSSLQLQALREEIELVQALVMSCREANEHLAAELMQLQAQRQQQLLSQCAPVQ